MLLAEIPGTAANGEASAAELRELFHQLNNQLSVILAHAELLEAKAVDDQAEARASQVVAGALGAMRTVRAIRVLIPNTE
jgi:hypothetical protein